MKTVILAGGKGTRLQPYTTVLPKPLVPVGDKPILDIIIQQLAFYGFEDIVLTVGYLSELIRAYFANGVKNAPKVKLSYVQENEPTGTAGSLRLVPGLNSTFMVMNGDLLTTLNYNKLVSYHKEKKGLLTIAMHKKRFRIELGVMDAGTDGVLKAYTEKPKMAYNVSMGIYVYEPAVLNYIGKDAYLDFPHLVQRLLDNKEKVMVYPCNDFWYDIGNYDDFSRAQSKIKRLKKRIMPWNGI